jgi:ligand-binding sensor domain-containing protein
MIRIPLVCLLLTLLFSCKKDPVMAPPPDNIPEWTLFNTTNSALPDNQINAIAIDRQDRKWLGTSKGLVRLQDEEWTVFDPANSPLPSSYVQAVAVEDNGTVWAGTPEGLARLSGGNWQVFTASNSLLTHNSIISLAHDPQRNITYVGTEGSTISIDRNNQWKILEESGNPVLSMAVDRNGVLWSGSFNFFAFMGRIRKYDHGQWSSLNLPDFGYTSSFPYSIAIDNTNKPIVTLSGTSVRAVVRINGNVFEEIPFSSAAFGFKTVAVDGDEIWAAGTGMCVLGDRNHPSLAIPGTDSPIQCMAIDSKGSKWLGTVYGGIARYHDR